MRYLNTYETFGLPSPPFTKGEYLILDFLGNDNVDKKYGSIKLTQVLSDPIVGYDGDWNLNPTGISRVEVSDELWGGSHHLSYNPETRKYFDGNGVFYNVMWRGEDSDEADKKYEILKTGNRFDL